MKLSSLRLLDRTLSELQLTWAIRFLFGISIALIVALSYSYHTINRELVYYAGRVDHTQEVQITIQKIASSVFITDYHLKNYLLLGGEDSKNEARQQLKILPVFTDLLDSLVDDNLAQNKRAQTLRGELRAFSRTVDSLVTHALPIDQASQLLSLRVDTKQLNRINQTLHDMTSVEILLMENRIKSRDNYEQQVYRFNWVIMVVALLFLSSSFILLDRELRRNKMYRLELENKIQNLNRSNEELEQFAYVASHDLQEPLRKIRSFSDRIVSQHAPSLPQEVRYMLEKIDVSAKRMQLLIDNLLSFSRIVRTNYSPKLTNLNTILLEVKNNLSETIKEKEVKIKSQDLPTVAAYPMQMVQLFQNLISNSIKYSKDGQFPEIAINYRLAHGTDIPTVNPSHRELQFHLIEFIDNGIGFSPEYADKIFVIFQRLHGRDQYEGTGIGLAICRRVVSNHNGYLIAEGKEGKGAKFCLYLPLQPIFN
ncbi:hypothetical protein GCM10027275_19190 [Rhabdobacter roseus]|uniref:histidine kinase n=1 Tax=Rhabdobacter roseus TaxID=1655419 RepID=A0A840TLP4_9BACT|nr:ATP-binding protein [Rhabdobacter roseus]MBB5283845.1 signal transduction histidine kinase [Rhabdobacter roseus]